MTALRMTLLVPRDVDTREAARLGVASGWYGTKASGTFVIGPYPTEETCLKEIKKVGPIAQDKII
jgi:hypothetical protein